MELKLLRTFQCVANCLNFSKAAEILNFSQPTVSTQIQTLEEELGQKLFVHVGKKTYLTQQGILLKEEVERLFEVTDEIEMKFKSMADTYKVVKIAAHESFCNLTLPDVINAYLKRMEQVDVELYSCDTDEVIEGIRKNKYDIGIISGDISYAGVNCIPVDSTQVDIVVASEIAKQYTLDEIVEKYPYIRYRADAMQYSIDLNKVIQKSGIIPKRTMKFESLVAIRKAVEEGLGYSVCTRDTVQEELRSGKVKIFTPPGIEVYSLTSAICLEDNGEREEIKEFINALKEVWIQDGSNQ